MEREDLIKKRDELMQQERVVEQQFLRLQGAIMLCNELIGDGDLHVEQAATSEETKTEGVA